MPRFSLIAPASAALVLAGCSEPAPEPYSAFISDNPEFVQIIEDARMQMRDGNLADAGRMLDEALAIDAENPALWVDIARLRYRGGEQLSALEAADRALELGPDYGPALLLKAQLVRDAHGLADAERWFEAAATSAPNDPEILGEYAATLGDLGRNTDMLTVLRQLAKISPDDPKALYLQSVLAARANKPVLARSLLAKSGMFQKGVPAALLLDAVIDIQQQSPDTAIETLTKLVDSQPANARARELLARALWLSGRDEELIERFGERATSDNAPPYLTMLVGRAHERSGDRETAAELIETALRAREVKLAVLASGNMTGPTARMRSLVARDAPGEAAQLGAELRREFPDSGDIRALAADAELVNGDPVTALALYGEASQLRRSWPLTRKIVSAYRAAGDDKAADTLLTRHVAGEPRNPEALLMLAQRLAQAKDWKRVAILLDQVIALGAGNDPLVLDLRAEAAEQLGDDKAAARFDVMAEQVRPSPLVRKAS